MQLFRSKKILPGITRIWGMADELMYLLEGTEKAVLVDSGCGIGNIKEYVKTLTQKEVSVLLTHGHIDHSAGAYLFSEIYLNPADDALYELHTSPSFVDKVMKVFLGRDKYNEVKDEILTPAKAAYKPLHDGMVFSLGGLTFEILDAKGHTRGSMVILIEELGILILGDACNGNTLVYDQFATTIEEFLESLKKLQAKANGRYTMVYFSHAKGEDQPGYIESAIQVCEDIINGKVDEIPYSFMGDNALLAKARDENFIRLDHGLANIVYSKDRIWKKKEV
jgi:glyoxylase-like metal-dependent hydrolase (beta-lactamase superfamily II)